MANQQQYQQKMGGMHPSQARDYPRDPRDSYSQPLPAPMTQQPGYYTTYPGPKQMQPQQQQQQPKYETTQYEKQYDNRGYREEPRYYDAPPNAQRRIPKAVLPDALSTGHNGRDWSTGLMECTKDPKTCMCVMCCSPFYEMYRAHEFGESCWNFSPCCLGLFGSTLALRHKIRERENIRGSLLIDCLTTTFCTSCTVCQLFRENDISRGADIGSPQAMDQPQAMDRY